MKEKKTITISASTHKKLKVYSAENDYKLADLIEILIDDKIKNTDQ